MKQHKPKISVIIPVYNVEKYLRRCLDSVLNQTFTEWQAICVDDGSPDNSGKIADEYAKTDQRFVVIHKENGGQSDARNVGLKYAQGEYVLYLDADDFVHPQTLEILCFYADKNDADLVVFDINKTGTKKMLQCINSGLDVAKFLPDEYNKQYDIKKIKSKITDKVLFYSTEKNHSFGSFKIRHCYPVLKMLRRTIANKYKFIKGIIIEDFPWWSDIMFAHPHTVIVKAPLYFYTPNIKSSLHSSKDMYIIKSIFTGLKYVFKSYKADTSVCEFNYFNRNFLWPFIIIAMRQIKHLNNIQDIKTVKKELLQMSNMGVFNNAQTYRERKYKRKIQDFISLIF